jgi:hypothetical protein
MESREASQSFPGHTDLSKALDEMEDGAPILGRFILVLLLEGRQRLELAYC